MILNYLKFKNQKRIVGTINFKVDFKYYELTNWSGRVIMSTQTLSKVSTHRKFVDVFSFIFTHA